MARAQLVIDGLREFQRALKNFAPEVLKEFREEMREVAQDIVREAQRRASWSTGKSGHGRVPSAISASITAKGVGVRVSKKKAPHGPLYERGSKGQGPGVVRHPLFGNRNIWRTSRKDPFLQPAVDAKRAEVEERMVDVIERTARKVDLQ